MDRLARGIYQMQPKRTFPTCVCLAVLSVALFAAGLALFLLWPALFAHVIDSNMLLKPGSHTYDIWREFPEDLFIDFYFFNWTNARDVYRNDSKPKLEQLGPYRFRETKVKANVTWNANGTVSFRHQKWWFPMEQADGRSLGDLVTTVNPVAISASYAARNWNYFIRKGLSFSLSSTTPSIAATHTAGEMLFAGYPDPIISLAKNFPLLAGNALPPWDRFGWFYTRNGSEEFEGSFNMGTGAGSTFGRLYQWNHRNQTPFYEGECGRVAGSAGEFFQPNVDRASPLMFFSPDLCRTIKLDFVGEVAVDGILGYKFSIDKSLLDNGTLFPENSCYCNGECVPSGMLNSSSCRFNSPAFASLPHFFKADPYYNSLVDGLDPDHEKHEFYIILEPTTAIPLEVSARLQINLLMQPIPGVSLFEKAPRVFFPMLWFEQKVRIPSGEAFYLKLLLNLPVICSSLGIILIASSLALSALIVYKICTTNICGNKSKRKIDKHEIEQTVPLRKTEMVKMPKSVP